MNTDIDKYKGELSKLSDWHDNTDQETGKVDEITIVIRGGKIVKFEQRLVTT